MVSRDALFYRRLTDQTCEKDCLGKITRGSAWHGSGLAVEAGMLCLGGGDERTVEVDNWLLSRARGPGLWR